MSIRARRHHRKRASLLDSLLPGGSFSLSQQQRTRPGLSNDRMHVGGLLGALFCRIQLDGPHNRVRFEGHTQRNDAHTADKRERLQQTPQAQDTLALLLLPQSQTRFVRLVHHQRRGLSKRSHIICR